MPIYFEMRSDSQPFGNRANADALSEILQDSLHRLHVRVVSIKRGLDDGYVYACASRRPPLKGAIVRTLRADKRLKKFAFSDEAATSDGPFDWTKV